MISLPIAMLVWSCCKNDSSDSIEARKQYQQSTNNAAKATRHLRNDSVYSVCKTDVSMDTIYVLNDAWQSRIYLMYSSYDFKNDEMVLGDEARDKIVSLGETLFFDFDALLSTDQESIMIANQISIRFDSVAMYKRKVRFEGRVLEDINLSKMQRGLPDKDSINNYGFAYEKPVLSCADTYRNKITLSKNNATLTIGELMNLKIYTADLNRDGSEEVYLFSFQSCSSRLRIYQII